MFKIIPKKNKAAEIICNLNKINKNELKKIKSTLDKYGMIYFPKQKLNSRNYLNFAQKFGKPANYPRLRGLNKKYHKLLLYKENLQTRDQALVNNFIQTLHIQKNLHDTLCCYQNWCLKKVLQILSFPHSI